MVDVSDSSWSIRSPTTTTTTWLTLLGFSAGNNLALRTISDPRPPLARFVWLLNPDTEVRPGATQALVDCMERTPRAGVVGAKLLYADGSLQHSAFRFPGLAQLAYELFRLPARFYNTPINGRYSRRLYRGETPFPIDHPLGAAMMVRVAAVVEAGLMDENYRMYCEEIDWCWRMRQAGWRAFCVPTGEVIHHAGQSSAQVPLSSFRNLWISRARLYARHHGPLTCRLARLMVRAGMRRKMRAGGQDVVVACREVLAAWDEVR